jgi:hypothetical protein
MINLCFYHASVFGLKENTIIYFSSVSLFQLNQKMLKSALIKDLYADIERLKQGFVCFTFSANIFSVDFLINFNGLFFCG